MFVLSLKKYFYLQNKTRNDSIQGSNNLSFTIQSFSCN